MWSAGGDRLLLDRFHRSCFVGKALVRSVTGPGMGAKKVFLYYDTDIFR
jgi:hypothetical protein